METTRTSSLPPPSSARPTRPPPSVAHLTIAAGTDPGRERRGNEDSFLVASAGAAHLPLSPSLEHVERLDAAAPGWVALAVCDGMGGAAAGEVASRLAVEAIRDTLARGGAAHDREELGRRLAGSLLAASRRIHATAASNAALSGMGTTATACVLQGNTLFIAQVGDSRAYLLREGRLTQLTRDQTLLGLLLERGQITPEEAESLGLGHIILQAVGTSDHVDVDLKEVRVRRGDVLLVCSDGLHGPVSDDVIREVLMLEASPRAAVEVLVALANDAGGPDNITAIVARVG